MASETKLRRYEFRDAIRLRYGRTPANLARKSCPKNVVDLLQKKKKYLNERVLRLELGCSAMIRDHCKITSTYSTARDGIDTLHLQGYCPWF